ncbi:hypothetical protein SH601_04890 [Gracilibacillus sp. S3-1-1]|uniref:Uncharacterized protein n=1 Tax=Gracilibacillus pellucidus TaxID=3095368 RepID=A0ACC6M318_9BACI|nr:hypothetical protein [Gracilibacillus sp. S3-1-1]MDX8045319.1 hypothetical protein [Gracilibacillus sp. S3-1-1]
MLKSFYIDLLTFVVAIIGTLLAAFNKTGKTISFEEPITFLVGFVVVVMLFLPSLILSLFNKPRARFAFAIYQGFIALLFLGLIPSGFLGFRGGTGASIIGIIGTVICIWSIVVVTNLTKRNKTFY